MASFCTKCGAAISSDTQFCPSCGTPTAAPAPAPAALPYQPASASYQPVVPAPYPAAPVPQKSGGVLKVVLIVVGVFIFLGILGAGVFAYNVWRFAHALHVEGNGSGGQMTVHTNGGTFTANSEKSPSASELGVDIYPGSQSGKGSVKMDMPTGSMVTGVFVTSDSKDQVLAFYKGKLGSEASTYDTSTGAVISMKKGDQEAVIVTITANSSQYDGKTQIAIVHTKSTKSS